MFKKKLIKKILFTCVTTFVLPGMVFAADDLFVQSCQKADGSACLAEGSTIQVEAGETITIFMSMKQKRRLMVLVLQSN